MIWQKFEGKYLRFGQIEKIRLYKKQLILTKKSYLRLDQPKFVNVYYDKDNEAIKLKPTKRTGFEVKRTTQVWYININLSSVMPIGIYKVNNKGIYLLNHDNH
jgi:hypothetical protein